MLLLKLALAPALVVGATVAGRRWGSRASGILIALPLVAGPILLVITLQHGEAFGARAARGSLLGVLALSAFCVVFARMTRLGWAWALAVGWLTYAAVAAAASRWDPPPLAGLAVALAAVAIARTLLGADDRARASLVRRRRGTCMRAPRRRPCLSSRSPPRPAGSARRSAAC
jgi:hypothetical protein